MERAATLSDDGVYRYDLTRTWGEGGRAVFVLLNPSIADDNIDDPTVAAALRIALSVPNQRIGTITIVNLLALRATDSALLRSHPDPVGPDNDAAIAGQVRDADAIVVGWGEQGDTFRDRVRSVLELLAPYQLWCLGTTVTGQPRHPQRRARSTPLIPFDAAAFLEAAGRPSVRKGATGADRGGGGGSLRDGCGRRDGTSRPRRSGQT